MKTYNQNKFFVTAKIAKSKEEQKYIDSIKEDITWLGYSWSEERYASDYFDQLHLWQKSS